MPRVESETIAWIGYEERGKTLFVRFREGQLCSYDAVPKALYAVFMRAESKTDFFETRIQDHFVWRRLPDDDADESSGQTQSSGSSL